jgi:hypothetical protein
MSTAYDTDVVAWSEEQAALLRAGKLSSLDIEHIADELEDVGKSEKRELASRLTVLLAHLLKWSAQPERRGASWRGTIKEQRAEVADVLDDAPSLRLRLVDDAWMERTWNRAVGRAMTETELDAFPETCPWTIDQVLDANFLPD